MGTIIFFFERTAQDSAHFIDIEEKTRLQLWEAIGREQKERKNKDSPGWIGTSTRVTAHRPFGLGLQHGRTTKPHPPKNHSRKRRAQTQHTPTANTLADIDTSTRPDAETGAEREQTSPHQEGRRRAGPL
jgi:hypothetical protein